VKRPSLALRARLREEAEDGDEISAQILADLAAYEAKLAPSEVKLRDLADAGDEEAARIADEREAERAAECRRANAPRADGGEGSTAADGAAWNPFRQPTFGERLNDVVREQLNRKKYGEREAPGNLHPSLTPKSEDE
jgi:hypothetical protein